MQLLSHCCKASIVPGTKQEYPLGGSTWYESFQIEVCEECGKEADPVEACDNCGEPFDGLQETVLGDYCSECLRNEVDERAEKIKQEWGLGA